MTNADKPSQRYSSQDQAIEYAYRPRLLSLWQDSHLGFDRQRWARRCGQRSASEAVIARDYKLLRPWKILDILEVLGVKRVY